MEIDPTEMKVVRQLGEKRRENDIIQDICTETGLSWDDATAFVEQVKADHQTEINRRHKTIVVTLGFTFVGAGVILTLIMIMCALTGVNIELKQIPIPYSGNLVFALFGIFLTSGGYLGLRDAW